MSEMIRPDDYETSPMPDLLSTLASSAGPILNGLPLPVLAIGREHVVLDANVAAEAFFEMSCALLIRHKIDDLVPFGSPLLALVEQVAKTGVAVKEYRVDLGNPKLGPDRIVHIYVSPLPDVV